MSPFQSSKGVVYPIAVHEQSQGPSSELRVKKGL